MSLFVKIGVTIGLDLKTNSIFNAEWILLIHRVIESSFS